LADHCVACQLLVSQGSVACCWLLLLLGLLLCGCIGDHAYTPLQQLNSQGEDVG
jgi:hypothetical protein